MRFLKNIYICMFIGMNICMIIKINISISICMIISINYVYKTSVYLYV